MVAGSEDDDALAARAMRGDHTAFDTLVLRYQARVYRLASRMVGLNDAADVVQETFLSAYRHLDSFRQDAKFSTWLYRIATNAALMNLRAKARRPSDSLDDFLPTFEPDGSHHGTPAQLQVAADVEATLDRRWLAEKAASALASLPEQQRSAFVLRDLEGLPTSEVAVILGIEPAAVRQRVHRARLILRGMLNAMAGAAQ
jgi:RNA polymerase sigma-70 factor, ECF subfamily